MPNQVQVGPQQVNDGIIVNERADNYGNTTVQQFNGKYAELARRGQLFLYSTPAQALLLSATTGNVATIWNPAGSGKVCFVLRLAMAWLSGANVAGSVVFGVTSNTGSAIGTAAPIVTWTDATIVPAMIGSGYKSSMRFAPSVCTFTAAPVIGGTSGFNFAATQPTGLYEQDYDGSIALYPGTALSLCYSVTTSTALFYSTVVCSEVPLPLGA